ncbi:MAG: SIR2 family protein [Bacteroidales bacterium]|nr:SIR2 family protein [Bacteroidales bacterium]
MEEIYITHDPSEYVRGLQQLLISDKKKIAFLFGAGTSLANKNCKSLIVPAIGEMTVKVVTELNKTQKYNTAIAEIKKELEANNQTFNVEALLSNLEQKNEVIGDGVLNKLKKTEIDKLIGEIKIQIRKIVSVHSHILNENNIENLIHSDFTEWIQRADRKYAIELFTTNYDYLFELGLESKNIPYYDGFTGSYQPFFNPESVEDLSFLPSQTKLWKLHGSLGWHLDKKSNNVWRKDSDNDDILIYPSLTKYNNSKKQPYVALMDRLTNFLKQPDTVLITCGYSFGDEHINERILTALKSNNSAHVYALYYDIVWNEGKKIGYELSSESNLTKIAKKNRKISIYGCRSAIIGCQLGDWQLKREPDKDDSITVSSYFAEDAFDGEVDLKTEKKGDELWTGKGELLLPDFSRFVAFLKSMIFQSELIPERK